MVKVSSWGKDVEGLFREHISVSRVLRRECYFVLVGGDSKFCREGGLADVFGIESHSFLFPIYVRIVLH